MKGGSEAKEGELSGTVIKKRDSTSKEKKEGDFRERSRESGKERDSDHPKERSKEREKLLDSLQLSSVIKQTSRSQSPALTDLRSEHASGTHQEATSSTSSKHSSERSHHSKSHSRDPSTTVHPAILSPQNNNTTSNTSAILSPSIPQQQKSTSKSMEDSPQKQLLSTTKPDYPAGVSSPSGYHSANVSYGLSSDEFTSPQSSFRANGFSRLDFRPELLHHHHILLKTLSQPFHHSSPYNLGGRDLDDGSPLALSESSFSSYEANGSISEHPEYIQHGRILGTPLHHSTFHQHTGGHLPTSASSPYMIGGEIPQHNYYAFQANQPNDETDTAGSGGSSRAATAIAHLNSKVARTKELIRLEQTIRDDNVNEYLKLAGNADKQQLLRIKAVFEKKNQKSAHSIAQLQKKLDGYHKRIKNWETHGSSGGQGSHRQPREVLRDMGQGLKNVGGNIRDGITGLGGTVMSKPREFAHLIKNKFGSADNINQMAARNNWIEGRRTDGEGPHTLPGALRSDSSGGGTPGGTQPQGGTGSNSNNATGGAGSGSHHNKLTSEEGSECSSVTSSGGYQGQGGNNNLNDFSIKQIFCELKERREDVERICDKLETIKTLSQEVSYISSALQEERFRSERLEEQINDLTELHQNEVENLKQALADVEEKVQYQSEERVRDIHEMLDLCQTKISKMEHQAMQQQQYVNLEGIEGFNARVLAVKLINVVLTVLQVILLLVATTAGILMPFLRTRDDLKAKTFYSGMGSLSQSFVFHIVRILTTTIVLVGAVFVLRQWPELWEISSHLIEKLHKAIVHNKGSDDDFVGDSSQTASSSSTFMDNR